MALPPRPTAPAQALRSNPDTFSLNAELAINYQWTAFPNWIEAMGDFVVARANEANAAALTGAITPAPIRALNYLRLNSGGTALEYRTPTETVGDLGQYGRNLIINGSGRINQRGYVSGTLIVSPNQFTLDRWFLPSGGQSLTFTGNSSARTMTAPAGGARQVIEGANVIGGTYVINWTGTAACTVNGVSRAKGATFTLTANTNVIVAFTNGTFTDVQLERGSVVTPFEWRSFGQELALCQRFYCTTIFNVRFDAAGAGRLNENAIYWPVTMRAAPVANLNTAGIANATASVDSTSVSGARASLTSTGAGDARLINAPVNADAELTA